MARSSRTRRSRATPAPRELFKNKAYEELRSRLDSRQYQPGMFLSERQLAEELGMSKTPIKAALERLEMEGFITVSPQSGIVVRELTIEEITEMYEIRVALEGFVLKSLASGGLNPKQMKQWEDNLAAYAEVDERPEGRQRAVALDAEFHMMPCEFLGNRLIINTMQQFSSKMLHVIGRVFSHLPSRVSQSLVEHRQIVESVRLGRGDRARQLSEDHLRVGHEIVCEAIHSLAQKQTG